MIVALLAFAGPGMVSLRSIDDQYETVRRCDRKLTGSPKPSLRSVAVDKPPLGPSMAPRLFLTRLLPPCLVSVVRSRPVSVSAGC